MKDGKDPAATGWGRLYGYYLVGLVLLAVGWAFLDVMILQLPARPYIEKLSHYGFGFTCGSIIWSALTRAR